MGAWKKWLVGAIMIATIGCRQNIQPAGNQELDANTTGIFGGQLPGKDSLLGKVVFRLQMEGGSSGTTCSAARIGANRYLTAAHCANADKILVYSSADGLIGTVAKVTIHPDYHKRSEEIQTQKLWNLANEFDVAVLELEDEAIPPKDKDIVFKLNKNLNTLNKIDVAGYGYESFNQLTGQKQGTSLLKWTELERKDSDQKEIFEFDQTSGKGICVGDSGGAAFREINSEIDLIGIAVSVQNKNSFDACMGSSNFIDIQSLTSWIFSILESNKD